MQLELASDELISAISHGADCIAGPGRSAVYQHRRFHGRDALGAAADAGSRDRTDAFGFIVSSYTFAAGRRWPGRVVDHRPLLTPNRFSHALRRSFCSAHCYVDLPRATGSCWRHEWPRARSAASWEACRWPSSATSFRRTSRPGDRLTNVRLCPRDHRRVPAGLSLGTAFGWHVPFLCLVVLGSPVLAVSAFALPPLDAHLGKHHAHPLRSLIETFPFAII